MIYEAHLPRGKLKTFHQKFVEKIKIFEKNIKKPVTKKENFGKIITPECTVMTPLHVVKIFALNIWTTSILDTLIKNNLI